VLQYVDCHRLGLQVSSLPSDASAENAKTVVKRPGFSGGSTL
jgi:hypothetical protein